MKAAILLPTWVGDACMATPTIRAIRKGMPEISELCLVGRYAPISVLDGNPWTDSTIIYKPKSIRSGTLSRRGMIAELRRKGIDLIILLPNSLSAGLVGYFCGAKRRVGYAKDGRSWLLTDRLSLKSDGGDMRRVSTIDYYLNIARYLGCETSDQSMQLWTSEADRMLAISMFDKLGLDWEQPTVVLNTSSATSEARLWPTGHASRTARELAGKHGLQVVIHAGPGDRQKANAIEYGACHPLVKSMGTLDDLPVGLSKAVLERASVVVSTDSGPRHMAVALNKRVISLFGPTSPDLYRTYNLPEKILRLSLDCSPCGKSRCPLFHNNCMHGIVYSQVVKAVLEIVKAGNLHQQPFVPIDAAA
ncbi:MAG: glycosyltransferase family 9 protein [Pirellula sp.]